MRDHDDSPAIGREACPDCGSSDALTRYASGRGFCYGAGCGRLEWPDEDGETKPQTPRTRMASDLITGDVRALRQRGISEETARHFGYKVGSYRGQPVHICPLHNLKGE